MSPFGKIASFVRFDIKSTAVERGDYFSTATKQGKKDCEGAGYTFEKIQGYVYPVKFPWWN